jgi:hypothetical protein
VSDTACVAHRTGHLTAIACAAVCAAAAIAPWSASAAPSVTDPGWNWAAPAMRDMVTHHGWPAGDQTALGRITTRRQLARGLSELMRARGEAPAAGLRRPPDVAATDPDATAISWVSSMRLLGGPGVAFGPETTVTGSAAETAIVRILGLGSTSTALGHLHTTNGGRFALPPGFAASVVVAELGLRHNYPLSGEHLATATAAPLPLAEMAGMIDGAMHVASWRVAGVQGFAGIVLPTLTANQRTVIQNALTEVGQPYIWGGTSPARQSLWGGTLPGGFDCSGLVWWSYKLGPGTTGLGTDIVGRTADYMAWERPTERVALTAIRPGDLIFFGAKGPKTARGGISHVGIYLGNGWMVHSNGSSDGTTVTNLATWWPSAMAWARRPAAMRTSTPPTTTPAPTTTPQPATHPPAGPMNRTLWRAVAAFVAAHYAPAMRAHAWRSLTANPAAAAALLTRQMTRPRWIALHRFVWANYAPRLRGHLWTAFTGNPLGGYSVLFVHNLL